VTGETNGHEPVKTGVETVLSSISVLQGGNNGRKNSKTHKRDEQEKENETNRIRITRRNDMDRKKEKSHKKTKWGKGKRGNSRGVPNSQGKNLREKLGNKRRGSRLNSLEKIASGGKSATEKARISANVRERKEDFAFKKNLVLNQHARKKTGKEDEAKRSPG